MKIYKKLMLTEEEDRNLLDLLIYAEVFLEDKSDGYKYFVDKLVNDCDYVFEEESED